MREQHNIECRTTGLGVILAITEVVIIDIIIKAGVVIMAVIVTIVIVVIVIVEEWMPGMLPI